MLFSVVRLPEGLQTFVLPLVTQDHRKRWDYDSDGVSESELAIKLSRGDSCWWAHKFQARLSKSFKDVRASAGPPHLLGSAAGDVRVKAALAAILHTVRRCWRCCVVSVVDETVRTTLCNSWQRSVLQWAADIVPLSTLKYAFGLGNDTLVQKSFRDTALLSDILCVRYRSLCTFHRSIWSLKYKQLVIH